MWATVNGVAHFFLWKEDYLWVAACGEESKILSGNDLGAIIDRSCHRCKAIERSVCSNL